MGCLLVGCADVCEVVRRLSDEYLRRLNIKGKTHLNSKFLRCAPHLPVKNLRQTLDYYRDILGFTDEWKFGEKDGGVQRDEMRLLFAENPNHVLTINTSSDRLPLIWFVEDIELIYREFQDRNVKITSPLQLHPYGMKEFAFVDVNEYYIRVSQPAPPAS